MNQSPLQRNTELKRGPGPKRKGAPKRTQPRRDWTFARNKVESEDQCRVWSHSLDETGCDGPLEAAHLIGRARDFFTAGFVTSYKQDRKVLIVVPVRIVPLCRKHHRLFDAHEIDLLPALTPEEQVQAVMDAGGLELARRRLAPTAYHGGEAT